MIQFWRSNADPRCAWQAERRLAVSRVTPGGDGTVIFQGDWKAKGLLAATLFRTAGTVQIFRLCGTSSAADTQKLRSLSDG
jgi:hypothetical protein